MFHLHWLDVTVERRDTSVTLRPSGISHKLRCSWMENVVLLVHQMKMLSRTVESVSTHCSTSQVAPLIPLVQSQYWTHMLMLPYITSVSPVVMKLCCRCHHHNRHLRFRFHTICMSASIARQRPSVGGIHALCSILVHFLFSTRAAGTTMSTLSSVVSL